MKLKFSDRTSFINTNKIKKSSLLYIGQNNLAHWRQRLRSWLLREILQVDTNSSLVIAEWENPLLNKFGLEKLKQLNQIDDFFEGPVFTDYPWLYFFRVNLKTSESTTDIHGWGCSITKEKKSESINKAIWESIERQATYYDPLTKKVTYPNFIQGNAAWLYELVPHFTSKQIKSDAQLVGRAADLEKTTGFYANCLTSGSKQFLPISCFYWGRELSRKEKILHDITSSGNGGGSTREHALLSGLYELIERDLFLLYWLAGVPPQPIEITTEEGDLFNHIREAKSRYNLEVYFLKLQYDLPIPVVICVIIDPILKKISMGGKASLCARECLSSSYKEALFILNLIRNREVRVEESFLDNLIKKNQWGNPGINIVTRTNLYCSDLGIATVKNLWLKPLTPAISAQSFLEQSISFPSHKSELKFVTDAFKKLVREKGEGYHIYEHYFESELTRLFESHVAGAFVPAFLKLHLNEHYVTPISDRLWSFARDNGLNVTSEADLNPLPHFFP